MVAVKSDMTDVVVVGAGAAGAVFAALLAESGKRVTILESGPDRRLSDLYSSQIWARKLKWAEPHVPETSKDSLSFNFNAGRGTGGAAVHHFGVWPRLHENDFKERSQFGKGLDWPIEYADLRPWYDRVQADVGVAGDAEAEIWRPPGEPYPLPPVPRFAQGEMLARGFEKLGLRVAPVPVAILTQPYKGRPACIWDGWCDAGCPTGALANPLVHYLPRARRAGAELWNDCHVTRLLSDVRGRRVTGVEYHDADGQRHELRADVVVLCAFTVENVRILLNSRSGRGDRALANRNGLVGAYLMSHPAVVHSGLFERDTQNHLGISGGQIINQDHFEKSGDDEAFGSRQWIGGLALKPNDLLGIAMSRIDIIGSELEPFMQKAARRLAQIVSIVEDQPLRENRVELAGNKDAWGYPLAQIRYQTSPDGMRLWQQSAEEGLAILKAAGATEAWHGPKVAQHIMGGTIMGDDPRASVTDQWGRAHEVENLFIGGGGLFPTSSAVNSTFTIHALAMRSADYLVRNWSGIAG
ncbi:MAG: GMC family oxidoreductase [Gammaproteobacteria bacterium]|nr:MAG: GMC family oxidoreductase [Gammaproteobacteria bacterium]